MGRVRELEDEKALEKEFRTMLRRIISLVLLAFPLFLSCTFLALVYLNPWPTNIGRRTFFDSEVRVLRKLTGGGTANEPDFVM